MSKQLLSDILMEARVFAEGRKSLLLSTVDESGRPHASYAPFVRDSDGNFYILVSELSRHTAYLESGSASILLIEDEADAKQIFARMRVGFQCDVEFIDRTDDRWQGLIKSMQIGHGTIIDTLASLADFRMYRLIPSRGRFVKGFGQAYDVNPVFTAIQPVEPDSLK